MLCDASASSSIWEAHYRCRYTRSEPHSESERKKTLRDNWRLLYVKRRCMDQIAISHLQNMVLDRADRYGNVAAIARMSLDVWDALDIESRLAIPVTFRVGDSENDAVVHPHALTRRYWARSMLDVIVRSSAIDIWRAIIEDTPQSVYPHAQSITPFERAVSALSCFFGRPVSEISSCLDQLAGGCKDFLKDKISTFDPMDLGYDLRRICTGVCQFMYMQGFGIAERRFRKMLNHFPHSYLTTNRRTLPISLVHVFVAISTRIGVNASPVDFPGTVIAHVEVQRPESHVLFVNPSTMDATTCIMDIPADVQTMVARLPIAPESMAGLLVPCKATSMLIRASRNLLAAFQEDSTLEYNDSQPAMLAAITIQILLQVEPRFLMTLMGVIELNALDCTALFLNKLSPIVSSQHRNLLERICSPILNAEAKSAATSTERQSNPTVRYFVGMAFKHARYGYTGCIVGWNSICKAPEDWMRRMRIDELTRGRNQPFYLVYADDSAHKYVAEENIICVNPTVDIVQLLYRTVLTLPVYFEDVELHEFEGNPMRGRFLLSPDSLRAYPDDDDVGARWVREGRLPY
ncbi:hypothetical protein AX17_000487 [Amanita inopinata Kibby_2008]|nr:hypothetical protein AX17_000487 [Amanita inopinata Kibby_2008]